MGLRQGLPNLPGLTGLSGKPTLPGLGGFPGEEEMTDTVIASAAKQSIDPRKERMRLLLVRSLRNTLRVAQAMTN